MEASSQRQQEIKRVEAKLKPTTHDEVQVASASMGDGDFEVESSLSSNFCSRTWKFSASENRRN